MNRKEYLPLLFVLILGACLRLYRIRDYLVFLGDEGRDVLVVKRMLIDHIPTLLGPITSVGGMYLGPIYYYFMAPFLWLFGYDPVGPAIMVVLFGIATIYLIYKTGRDFFNLPTGLIASFLYALSPTVIVYSHSSWNPNILPFFSIVILYGLLHLVAKHTKWHWFFIIGLSLGVSLQLHYLALLFIPLIGIIAVLLRKTTRFYRWVFTFAGGIITFFPYILFELRHQFTNTQTVFRFITKHEGGSTFGNGDFLTRIQELTTRLFGRLVFSSTDSIAKILVLFCSLYLLYRLFTYVKGKKLPLPTPFSVLSLWFLVGLLLYTFYQGAVYDYYFTPLFPLPFLIVGYILSLLIRKNIWGKGIALGIILFCFFQYSIDTPLRTEPNRLVDQIENISRFVYTKTEGKPYNFALMSSGNSDHAYRYFLELWGHPPESVENAALDPGRKTVKDQLLIVCEEQVCQPLGNSLWEIAGYGPAEVDGIWEVFPVKIIRLVPYKHE